MKICGFMVRTFLRRFSTWPFFESVLTWGHITTSTCRSLIVVSALRVPLFVGGESGIFAYSPPLFGYTILPATTNFNRPWCVPLTLTV